jgi:hypothetical protein
MPSLKPRIALAALAALAVAATLAVAAGPANAVSRYSTDYNDTTYSYEPTGPRAVEADGYVHRDYETGDQDEACQKAVEAANSWLHEASERWVVGGNWQQALANADTIAGQANKKGCTITHPE